MTGVSTQQEAKPPALRQLTRYIRVRSPDEARFVEFDFAIGEPSLFVELVLPRVAFEQFCEQNQVVQMTEAQMAAVDAEMVKSRYGEETLMAKNTSSVPTTSARE